MCAELVAEHRHRVTVNMVRNSLFARYGSKGRADRVTSLLNSEKLVRIAS